MPGLEQIDHFVFLMMENRSFDHMLGYLRLERGRHDLEGLRPGMKNSYLDVDYHPFLIKNSAAFLASPCHQHECVLRQIADDNGGFVADYAARVDSNHPGDVMGYFNGDVLTTYDFLAERFTICDRWFSSYLGDTFANRLFALCGTTQGDLDGQVPPIYEDRSTFFRHLDDRDVSWRAYKHNFHTPKLIDGKYLLQPGNHFAGIDEFYRDAAAGALPSVTWLDPDLYIATIAASHNNDDHPPVDVAEGQLLVRRIYNALVSSPQWSKTLFVITYDEHGGFHDHLVPPPASGDGLPFQQLGVRVPAIIVSPWVGARRAEHTTFDHTSIIRTVLNRFCKDAQGNTPDMGVRALVANDLSPLITEAEPRKDARPMLSVRPSPAPAPAPLVAPSLGAAQAAAAGGMAAPAHSAAGDSGLGGAREHLVRLGFDPTAL